MHADPPAEAIGPTLWPWVQGSTRSRGEGEGMGVSAGAAVGKEQSCRSSNGQRRGRSGRVGSKAPKAPYLGSLGVWTVAGTFSTTTSSPVWSGAMLRWRRATQTAEAAGSHGGYAVQASRALW